MMRMKDSDDYITARAANPWTGLISPSCGSPSPQPGTPDSPAEALKLYTNDPPSPTPASKARPALSRANEGRKVSAGTLHRLRADRNGWVTDGGGTVASPRGSHTVAKADLFGAKSRLDLADDKFVVNMPSAREPQPFTYPGCTASQIAVLKNQRQDDLLDTKGFGNVTAASFAPFASPKTPVSRGYSHHEDKLLRTVHASKVCCSISPPAHVAPVPLRKPVQPHMLARWDDARGSPSATANSASLHDDTVFGADRARETADLDLRRLPPVKLVHPSLIARSQAQPQQVPARRVCSLGCRREGGTNLCGERAHANVATSRSVSATLLFDVHDHHPAGAGSKTRYEDIVSDGLTAIVLGVTSMLKYVHWPDMAALSALRLTNATPQQKIDGLKAVLLLVSQASAVLFALAVAWRLSMLITQTVVTLFWPLLILLRVAKWLASG